MTSKIDESLKDALRVSLEAGLSDDAMKAVKKQTDHILCDIESDLQYRIKDELAPHLVGYVVDMAEKSVEQLLKGNEDQMRRYLSCEKHEDGTYIAWTSRSDSKYWGRQRAEHQWHPIIHGKLFEQGALALRKQIVDAHRETLTNERILDLEDQVKSLVAQVNKANAEKDEMWQRYRSVV